MRCPKCKGLIVQGGIRFGQYVTDLWSCLQCGLHSEQRDYYDAQLEVYRSMVPPHAIVAR